MAERGYARATVAEIARQAGLSPGLVHYHFTDKQAILLALGEALRARLQRRFESRLAGAEDAFARVVACLEALTALDDEADPGLAAAWAALGAEAARMPEVGALYQAAVHDLIDRLTPLMAEALEEAGRSAASAPELAVALFANVEGLFRLASAAPGTVPEGQGAALLILVARGLVLAAPEVES